MAHNRERADRMRKRSDSDLKRFVDAGSLSSAAASFALRERGVVYPVYRGH